MWEKILGHSRFTVELKSQNSMLQVSVIAAIYYSCLFASSIVAWLIIILLFGTLSIAVLMAV